ncbi:MAG: FtsW/RodA/SpoVE family cell cycle protein [Flaviflexus sp.]|nr:FtsW/RodA/SpoVE family cell cycle protein [Flaviflexus sp.]
MDDTTVVDGRVIALRHAIILTLAVTSILTIIGVVMVFSATSVTSLTVAIAHDNPALRFSQAQRQLMYAIVGFILLPIAVLVPARVYQRMSWPLFGLGLILQALVVTPLGIEVGGNVNWIAIGPIQIQPGEFLKLAVALWLAIQLGRLNRHQLSDWKAVAIPSGLGALVALGAVMLGKDMGTGIIYVIIYVTAFWLAGLPLTWFAYGGILVAVAAVVLVAIAPSRLARVGAFITNLASNPDLDKPTQSDYAMWAFGTGGIGGVGLGASREKWNYLPEAHNDFIFAVVGEELGLGGALAIVILYVMLGWGLVRIIIAHPQMWVKLFVAMVAMWLVGQAVLNMMVVTGALPVFGVPLPFISQGGSALIAGMLAIGVSVSLALSAPGVRETFRMPPALSFRSTASIKRSSA